MTKPVSIQQRIRILDAQGVSWREIARRLGVSRDTVRKYATMEDCSPKPAAGKGRRSLIDAYSGTVDSWLFADRLMPRKQRHTARRVYARLVEEEGFEGSYSSVQRYVKRWREEHRSDGDGYLELDWSAGVMQVDFGEAVATIGGGDVKVHCLVATFPHSNMRYVAAMPGENAECVCEGLARIFDHIGMVPRVLVLDNATGAGHRVAWNKVTVVRVFAMFCDHYRLETRFCNPYSGNEKGSVENAVGFLRRNLMVPKPNAESHRQPARFFTAAGLVMRLLRASAEGRLDRELAAISKARLLVIDELGYVPVDEEGSRLLFQVVTDAYERQSVIYTTNIEFSGWGRVFGDPNMATAIVDRTVHHGRMIRFEGESYRRTHALMG